MVKMAAYILGEDTFKNGLYVNKTKSIRKYRISKIQKSQTQKEKRKEKKEKNLGVRFPSLYSIG